MKKNLISISLAAILVFSMFTFAGCQDKKEVENHTEHEYGIVTEVLTGKILVKCSVCGEEKNLYDSVDESKYDSDEYNFKAKVNKDGTLTVMSYLGNSHYVKIPAELNGKKVVSINLKNAFAESPEIYSVIVSEGIEKLEKECFAKFNEMETIYLPSSLRVIEDGALSRTDVKRFYLPEGLEKIGAYQFEKSITEFVYIPSTVNEINTENIIRWNGMTTSEDYAAMKNPKGFSVSEKNQKYSSDSNGILYENGQKIVDPSERKK